MPVYLRRFYIKEFLTLKKKEKQEMDKNTKR